MTATSPADSGPPSRRIRWRREGLVLALLLAITFTAQRVSRQSTTARREAAGERPQTLTSAERLGVSLLGGFRAIAINVVWVRMLNRLSEDRFEELLFLFAVRELLQPAQPSNYGDQCDRMVFDVARKLISRPDERWEWIRRGLRALERGRQRIPGDPSLLWKAEYAYFFRFHPKFFPEDRARFLREKPDDLVAFGTDPLDLARKAAEEAVLDPRHTFFVDKGLWAILSWQRAGGVEAPQTRQRQFVERAEALIRHVEAAHRLDPTLREELEQWKSALSP